jgi:hypothetical protein
MEEKIEKVSAEKGKQEDFIIREATEEVQVPSTEIARMETKNPPHLAIQRSWLQLPQWE